MVPRSFATIGRLTDLARRERPDVAVVIDFPDFHLGVAGLGLAPRLKALGIPVVYYIPPQLWAWRRARLTLIKRVADKVLVIFPFEEKLYQDAGIPVEFVGHPLIDLARPQEPSEVFRRAMGLDASRPVVALLPGSRPNEVERLLPVMRDAAQQISRKMSGVQFVIARAPALDDRLFTKAGWGSVSPIEVLARTDDVLAASDAR